MQNYWDARGGVYHLMHAPLHPPIGHLVLPKVHDITYARPLYIAQCTCSACQSWSKYAEMVWKAVRCAALRCLNTYYMYSEYVRMFALAFQSNQWLKINVISAYIAVSNFMQSYHLGFCCRRERLPSSILYLFFRLHVSSFYKGQLWLWALLDRAHRGHIGHTPFIIFKIITS